MQMNPCDNGHYYEQSKHSSCPYCSPTNNIKVMERKTEVYENREITKNEIDSNVTQLFRDDSAKEVLLTAGWIVITKGKSRGKSYVVSYGMNNIGREKSNHICIDNKDNSISREKHCSLVYDFENRLFFIGHDEGRYLTYLNGTMVSALMPLRNHDQIKIGGTEFVFVALCGDDFQWEEEVIDDET